MANIKKIKIGDTAYDIRDASVPGQISAAIGNLDSSATVASESGGTITITKTVAETDGKIGNGTGSTATYTTTKIEDLVQKSKDYADIAYLEDSEKPGKLFENQLKLLKQPVCRNGKTAATAGLAPKIWETWK